MELALARIHIPANIISLLHHIHCNREDQIITSQGLTKPYHIDNGIDQGKIYSPLLWQIFYDPILIYIKTSCKEEAFIFRKENTDEHTHVNHLAFVDDMVWISSSK